MDRLETPAEEQDHFPSAGFRARRWLRFERDLAAWLASPEGNFAQWRAQQAVEPEG
jgi:hypothetical protein